MLLPFVHVLVPQDVEQKRARKNTQYKIARLKELIKSHLRPGNAGGGGVVGKTGRGHGTGPVAGAAGGGKSSASVHSTLASAAPPSPRLAASAGGVGHGVASEAPMAQLAALAVGMADLGGAVDAVVASQSRDASAVSELSSKVEVLSSEVAGLRDVLTAVLEQMQAQVQAQHRAARQPQPQQEEGAAPQHRASRNSGESGGGDAVDHAEASHPPPLRQLPSLSTHVPVASGPPSPLGQSPASPRLGLQQQQQPSSPLRAEDGERARGRAPSPAAQQRRQSSEGGSAPGAQGRGSLVRRTPRQSSQG